MSSAVKTSRSLHISAMMIMALAAGCHTPSAPTNPQTSWTAPEWVESQSNDDWMSLRSQTLSTTGALALAELVDQALQANPSLQKSWSEARQYEAQVGQARSAYYPTLSADGKYQLGRSDNNTLEKSTAFSSYGPEASINWLLLDLGGRSAKVNAAIQQLLASNYQFNQSIQDVLRDVQKAYYNLYSAQAAIEAAQSTVESSAKTLEATQAKEKAGLGIHLDVLQAQTDHEQALYKLEDAVSGVKTAQGALATTLGLAPDVPLTIAPPQQTLPSLTNFTEEAITTMIDRSLEHRPDIAALRASLRAAEYSVKSANSDYWPTLSAGAQADKTWNRYDEDQFPDSDSYTYAGYLGLSWTVFDGFLNVSKKNESLAKQEMLRAQLRNAELAAGADVWNAFYTLKSALKKEQFARAARASADEAYTQALDSFNAGLKDITFLLSAQAQQATARSTLVAAENEMYIALVNLAHATGSLSGEPDSINTISVMEE